MSRRRRGADRFGDSEDLNPMNYVSNLSDVMLIFAVGIMLALVMHWGVDMKTAQTDADTAASASSEYEQVDESELETFTEEERESMQDDATLGDLSEGMEKTGEVYYDADTGTYYIVENRDSSGNSGD